jgi:hypothetical protein
MEVVQELFLQVCTFKIEKNIASLIIMVNEGGSEHILMLVSFPLFLSMIVAASLT